MNYSAIKYFDIANGYGVRVSLFVSGCTHHCKGCFNEVAWPFDAGEPFTVEIENRVLDALEPEYIQGLSLLGGEPMEKVNQRALVPFLRKFKERFPQKDMWVYTGYVYEPDLLDPNGRAHCEVTDEFLSMIDMLVDGPFVQELYDISLLFRGSSNQRLLDLNKMREGKGFAK